MFIMASWRYCVIFSSLLVIVRADIFASVVDLTAVLNKEKNVIQVLKDYVEKEAERLVQVTEMINSIEEINEQSLENPAESLSNIISGFRMISRLTIGWEEQKYFILSTQLRNELETELNELTQTYPTMHDLKLASDSIFRLQDVYLLTPEQFANGSLAKYTLTMTAKDCFEVANQAYILYDFYHATMWFEEALSLSKKGDTSMDRGKIYDYLVFAYVQGKIPENLGHVVALCREWVRYDPQSTLAKNNLERHGRKLEALVAEKTQRCNKDLACERDVRKFYHLHDPVFTRVRKDWEQDPDFMRYETLCRGENVHEEPGLTCSYRSYSPLHVLNPLKEEVFLRDPFIAVYHDFISDREIEVLKDAARDNLKRSIIFGTIYSNEKETHVRTSKTAWIEDDVHPLIERVTMRSVSIGNLSSTTCEKMQVACYGLGGHYGPHFDWDSDAGFGPELGDRMATVVHYLSEFDGGYTAFIPLGVRIPPEKGATLFWWNLHKNLSGDVRNKHAGCPVIYGNKWIANKWVHRMGQAFHRPCDLDPNA